MNLNEQLRQAYEAGRLQGLNEQGVPGGDPFGPLFPNFVGPIDPSQGIVGDDSYEPSSRPLHRGPTWGDIIGFDEYGKPVYYGDPPSWWDRRVRPGITVG